MLRKIIPLFVRMTYITVSIIIPSVLSVLEAVVVQNLSLSDYSYLALVGTYTDQSTQLTSACAGCILNRRFILTTAHCFRAEENWVALIGSVAHEKFLVVLERWILHPHYIATVGEYMKQVYNVISTSNMDLIVNIFSTVTCLIINRYCSQK